MFGNKTILFQVLILIISFIFILIGSIYFIKQLTNVTDENLFNDIPSPLYITGINQNILTELEFDHFDSLFVGAFIKSIDSISFKNKNEAKKNLATYLRSKSYNDSVLVSVINYTNKTDISEFIPVRYIPFERIEELETGAVITYIFPEGASERAGLRVGDVILKINQDKFSNIYEADELIRDNKPGSKLEYLILRGGDLKNVEVTLPKFGISYSMIILMLSGLALIFIGVFLGIKRSQIKGARITSVALLFLGFSYIFNIIQLSFLKPNLYTLILNIVSLVIILNVLPILLHSFLYFPNLNKYVIKKKWVIITPYIFSYFLISLLILFSSGLLNNIVGKEIENIFSFGLIISYVGFQIFFLIFTQFYFRKKIPEKQKKQRRLLYLSFLINLIVFIGQAFLFEYELFKLREMSFTVILLIPIAYIITISKYKVFELDLRVKRNYQYVLIKTGAYIFLLLILALFIFFVSKIDFQIPNLKFTGTSIEVLKNPITPEMEIIYQKVIFTLFTLIFSLILWRLSKIIFEFIDKSYHRNKLDYFQAARSIIDIDSENYNYEDISSEFLRRLSGQMHLKRAGLLIFKDDNLISQNFYGFSDSILKEYCGAVSNKFINNLQNHSNIIPIDYLAEDMKIILKQFNFKFISPIWSKSKIIGIVFIGDKLSETTFTDYDISYLNIIINQTSVLIENVFLYDNLAKQERYKSELDIARKIQLQSLPSKTPELDGLQISAESKPALEVGGDFYDFLNISDSKVNIIIGDVSGKGTSSALYMSKVQGIMRTLQEFNLSPKQLLCKTNTILYKNIEKKSFITAISSIINLVDKKITLARAGHHPLYHFVYTNKEVKKYVPQGFALGMVDENSFDTNLEEIHINFNPNDILIFITDGVLENRNKDKNEYPESVLIDLILSYNEKSADELKKIIMNSLNSFNSGVSQHDDITIVIVKMNKIN